MSGGLTGEVIMDVEAFAAELLDTPVGDLELRRMPGGWIGCCIKSGDDLRPGRCLLDMTGRQAWDAIYGKRKFEARPTWAAHNAARERTKAAHDATYAELEREQGLEFDAWLKRCGDHDSQDILLAGLVR